MVRVQELFPGDIVILGDQSATFIASSEHPIYPSLQLVIWKMEDGTWSLDALSETQEVGEAPLLSGSERWRNIQRAFGDQLV